MNPGAPFYPLGAPINRTPAPGLVPAPGRPNWWRDAKGVDRYIEPVPPGQVNVTPVSAGVTLTPLS